MSASLFLCTDHKQIEAYLENELNLSVSNNPDLYLLNQDNQAIKIKQIREINEQIAYPPTKAQDKIFVLFNFDKTTIPAQNAFLKNLEEHPHYVKFILQAKSLQGILETIQSRVTIKSLEQINQLEPEKEIELEKLWNNFSSLSYADLIELASRYKDREEALQFIQNLIFFLHQFNQKQPTSQAVFALERLGLCLSQLEQNSNVLLTLEDHLFAIKSRF